MKRAQLLTAAAAVFGTLLASAPAVAQSDDAGVELIVGTGTPLRIALDKTVAIRRVGQVVTGTLIEPLYAYDRVVLPVGTPVVGHIASLEGPSRLTRLRAWSGGDFAPKRHVVIRFESFSRDGETVSFQALGLDGMSNVRRHVAAGARTQATDAPGNEGTVTRAGHELKQKTRDSIEAAKQQVSEAIAAIKEPGRMERLKLMLIDQLPYHRQYLPRGTVYDAALQASLSFGRVEPVPSAAEG